MKQVIILEGKLTSLLEGYIRDIKEQGEGFEGFSDESIIYAFLEYSKFPRPYKREQRIKYLYEKCCEYSEINYNNVIVEFNEIYNYFIVRVIKHSSLPF